MNCAKVTLQVVSHTTHKYSGNTTNMRHNVACWHPEVKDKTDKSPVAPNPTSTLIKLQIKLERANNKMYLLPGTYVHTLSWRKAGLLWLWSQDSSSKLQIISVSYIFWD